MHFPPRIQTTSLPLLISFMRMLFKFAQGHVNTLNRAQMVWMPQDVVGLWIIDSGFPDQLSNKELSETVIMGCQV